MHARRMWNFLYQCYETVCVDRSARDVCLNTSASFSTATAAMRVNKDFPTHLKPTRWARKSSTTY